MNGMIDQWTSEKHEQSLVENYYRHDFVTAQKSESIPHASVIFSK